jgi:hypothetical protein
VVRGRESQAAPHERLDGPQYDVPPRTPQEAIRPIVIGHVSSSPARVPHGRRVAIARTTTYDEPMRRAVLVLGVVLLLAGAVWTAQGLGVRIGRSFMIGDRAWMIYGLLTALAGALAIAWARRARDG